MMSLVTNSLLFQTVSCSKPSLDPAIAAVRQGTKRYAILFRYLVYLSEMKFAQLKDPLYSKIFLTQFQLKPHVQMNFITV